MTFALLVYNNGSFVREAVEAALAQDYEQLQIIISDDCSTDDSAEQIDALVKSYRGNHSILVNRNPRNLGIADHLNRIAELATGEYLVLAAGDDVSDPSRTAKVADVIAQNAEIAAVVSDYSCIDSNSNEVSKVRLPLDFEQLCYPESMAKQAGAVALGAVFTYRRDCFVIPGPIPGDVLCEDCYLPMRAAVLGKIVGIHQSLVKYRIHDHSLTAGRRFESADYVAAHQKHLIADWDAMHGEGLTRDQTYRAVRRNLLRYPSHVGRMARLRGPWLSLYRSIYDYRRTLRRVWHRLFRRARQNSSTKSAW